MKRLFFISFFLIFLISCKQNESKSNSSEDSLIEAACSVGDVSTVSCASTVPNSLEAEQVGVCNADKTGFNYGECVVNTCALGYEANSENTSCVQVSTSTSYSLSDDAFFIGHSLVGVTMPVMLKALIDDGGGTGVADYQVINGSPLV